jgi:hypothetical protein
MSTYRSAVDQDGCDRLMFGTFADDLNPVPTGGPGADDGAKLAPKAVAAVGAARALAYSASQGLSVPMRSSVYRRLAGSADLAADAAESYALPAQITYATGHAVLAAGVSAYNGTCH